MNPQNSKRLMAVAAIAIAAGVLGYVSYGGIGENLVYFWDVKELLDKGDSAFGATVRLGGVVKSDSLNWDPKSIDLRFKVAMEANATEDRSVVVRATGAPPQMFREGIGVVVEGTYDGKVFHADRVIVKHSNEYQPPKEGERPQDIYKTLLPDES